MTKKIKPEIGQEEFVTVSSEDLKERYPHLSSEDIAFLTTTDKAMSLSGTIGRNKYSELILKRKSYAAYNEKYPHLEAKALTETEIKQIEDYEAEKKNTEKISLEKTQEHLKNVRSNHKKKVETIPGWPLDKKTLYYGFKSVFKNITGKDFIENRNSIKNLEVVVKYFCKDESFFECERLVKVIDGVELAPSFGKGLLIIGHFGNGKSTILRCMDILINHYYKIAALEKWETVEDWWRARFKLIACHELVSEYEWVNGPEEKENFIKKYTSFSYGFDDLTKEKIANNYGNINVIQSLIEKRYDKSRKTFGTINYHESFPDDITNSLKKSISDKYGSYIYDRLFQMFNIVEFKGKSFRK